ncbi:MAG: hypothetical protein Q8N99_08660 [Nanoarchaeota archaeon]|nr:hypothetical protein [Nanoarchaeota archaeon]
MENISLSKEELKLDSKLLAKAVIKLMKKDISERYKQTGEVTDEDWEFCEQIDWHPVDEMPPKPEHLEELKRRLREEVPGKKYASAEEFFDSLK